MTKKPKSRNKVTKGPGSNQQQNGSTKPTSTEPRNSSEISKSTKSVKNGKITSPPDYLTSSHPSTHGNNAPSLASVPGIVDDFLAPKFVKVLNLSDDGYDKNTRSDKKSTDNNDNKVDSNTSTKKNRRKNKPIKNVNASVHDCENGRELDVLNVNGAKCGDNLQAHLKAELSKEESDRLAKLERIRNSAFTYDGNNIVIVPNLIDGPPLVNENDPQYQSNYGAAGSSGYDYVDNFDYDAEDCVASGGGPGSASAPSDETSILGLDLENEDDEEERVGSWSLSHHEYGYPSKQPHSSSIASSESENVSSSTTASGGNSRCCPSLTNCSSMWDGGMHLCEIKDCSNTACKKCSQCKSAYYCGEEHQRMDWKKHKNECIPYRMDCVGGDDISVAVAAKMIPEGQLIFSEKPLFVFPLADPENDFINIMEIPCIQQMTYKPLSRSQEPENVCCNALKPACLGCLKSVEFIGPPRFKCCKCSLPLCSYNCQMMLSHMMGECQAIEAQGGWIEEDKGCYHTMYMDVEILRALQLETFDHPQWERFLQMKQNVRVETYKESSWFRKFINNYRELVPISAKMTGYHDDLIGNVHAIITALSFRPVLKSTYKLLFSTQILFGHDCVPNTFHYLEEGNVVGATHNIKLYTKAAVTICKKDPITIDFVPTPFMYYPLRRMVLRNMLCIENCACRRCVEPSRMADRSADIKCPRCRHGLICATRPPKWRDSVWECNMCLEEFSYRMIHKITTDCRDELGVIMTKPRHEVVKALYQFIQRRQDHDLNPGHTIILQAWSFIQEILKASLAATRVVGPAPRYPENIMDEYRMLGKCCEVIDCHLAVVRPGISFERGFILFDKFYVEQTKVVKRYEIRAISRKEYIQELLQCIRLLQEALKIFQMYDSYNKEISQRTQEATSALVTTKSFIQQLLIAENEENKRFAAANSKR